MGTEDNIATLARLMDAIDELNQTCTDRGFDFKSSVTIRYLCDGCGLAFDEPEDCEMHEADCEDRA